MPGAQYRGAVSGEGRRRSQERSFLYLRPSGHAGHGPRCPRYCSFQEKLVSELSCESACFCFCFLNFG